MLFMMLSFPTSGEAVLLNANVFTALLVTPVPPIKTVLAKMLMAPVACFKIPFICAEVMIEAPLASTPSLTILLNTRALPVLGRLIPAMPPVGEATLRL